MAPLVQKVIKAIAIERIGEDFLTEVYFAGLWHGAEIMRQKDLPAPPPPRKIDRIEIKPRRNRKPRP